MFRLSRTRTRKRRECVSLITKRKTARTLSVGTIYLRQLSKIGRMLDFFVFYSNDFAKNTDT